MFAEKKSLYLLKKLINTHPMCLKQSTYQWLKRCADYRSLRWGLIRIKRVSNYICKIPGEFIAKMQYCQSYFSRNLVRGSRTKLTWILWDPHPSRIRRASGAHILRSFRVKAIGGVVKTKVADAQKEMRPVVASTPSGNRFWTSSGIKPRGIFDPYIWNRCR